MKTQNIASLKVIVLQVTKKAYLYKMVYSIHFDLVDVIYMFHKESSPQ